MRQKIEIYKDTAGKWRWRFVSNGRIMADSGQGYSSRRNALLAINRFYTYLVDGQFECEYLE